MCAFFTHDMMLRWDKPLCRDLKRGGEIAWDCVCYLMWPQSLPSPPFIWCQYPLLISLSLSLSLCLFLDLLALLSSTTGLPITLTYWLYACYSILYLALPYISPLTPITYRTPEPSLEVAAYLKEACINKVIVGHQPRGDAPLVIDLGTGVQVRIGMI